jgi:hypothetical protein
MSDLLEFCNIFDHGNASAMAAEQIQRFYSSPFYRYLQTISRTIEAVNAPCAGASKIRGETGLRDWYSKSSFKNPIPAEPELLAILFPCYDLHYPFSYCQLYMGRAHFKRTGLANHSV